MKSFTASCRDSDCLGSGGINVALGSVHYYDTSYPHENMQCQDSVAPSLAAELLDRIEKIENIVADEMKKLFEEFACLERDMAYLRVHVGDLGYEKRNTQEHLAKLSHGLDHVKQDLSRKTADSLWLVAEFARGITANVSMLSSEIDGLGLKNGHAIEDYVVNDCPDDDTIWPSRDRQELWKQVEQLELLAGICNFEDHAILDTARINRPSAESNSGNLEQSAICMSSTAPKPQFEQCAQPGNSKVQLQSSQRLSQHPSTEPTRFPCSANGVSKRSSRELGLLAPPDTFGLPAFPDMLK